MITIDPFLPTESGHATDPVLMGVTRGLAQVLAPVESHELPEHIAELVRRLHDRDVPQEG